ncbi:MAG: zinc ribbon domain-containing protein, partial [Chloroflexi bacterium]
TGGKNIQPVVNGTSGNGKGKDELEEMIATRKRERKESAAGFCPRCGKPVQKSDKFCSKCGATL